MVSILTSWMKAIVAQFNYLGFVCDRSLTLTFLPRKQNKNSALTFDVNEVKVSELRILNNYMIDAWCSNNALSPGLRKEAKGKAYRHGAPCCLKTMRDIRNAVREHTIVVRRLTTPNDNDAVAATRRIMDFTEEHKMQSAPLFAGKFTDDGW